MEPQRKGGAISSRGEMTELGTSTQQGSDFRPVVFSPLNLFESQLETESKSIPQNNIAN